MSDRRREMMGYYKMIQDEQARKKVKSLPSKRISIRCVLCCKEIKLGYDLSFHLLRLDNSSSQRKTRISSILGDRVCYSCHLDLLKKKNTR